MRKISYREALNEAMCEEMARDANVFLMGEEVGAYDGAYKVSQGMLQKFGPERVVDTPIAEGGFAGIGIGAALVGLRPIVEFMTWNFSLVAIDQLINNAAKLRYMSGGQFRVPITFRGPGGSAHMLGAQHSQNLEAIYAHVPGLKVLMPSTPRDAKGLLKTAIRDDDPVIFIESELLYGELGEVEEADAGELLIPIRTADVKRTGKDVTLVCWAKMVRLCLAAAAKLAEAGYEAEVVDLRSIRPLDVETVLTSVRKTNRLVVVEEGWPFGGVGAQIAFEVQERAFDHLDAPVLRVTGADVPMPYASNLEHAALPDVDKVVAAARRVLYAG